MKDSDANSISPFVSPKFRDGATVDFLNHGAEINYRDQGAQIDFSSNVKEDAHRLLTLLQQGGRSHKDLSALCPDVAGRIADLVREFDRLGLVTESAVFPPAQGKSGQEFWSELQRFTACWEGQVVDSSLHKSFIDGTASRNQIIGYVLEYYHIVHLCPGLIGPALGHLDTEKTRALLAQFMVSEIGHDAMIADALFSVGILATELATMQPLPTTFAICSSLGVYASQHPLSLKAELFLLERPQPEFHFAFRDHCRRLDLPDGFIQPILNHAGINSTGNHEDISRTLLSEVAFVSVEEEVTVKKHVAILLESMAILERQILDYYGNPDNPMPRCFQ